MEAMQLAASRPADSGDLAALFRERRGRSGVHVLDEVPELGADLGPAESRAARMRCVAARVGLVEGPWTPPCDPERCDSWLGLLILDGLLVRTVDIAGMRAQEILGPGDLLRPWDDDGQTASVPAEATWQVIQPASLALLDGRFAVAAAPWPAIGRALLRGAVQRGYSRSVLLAIAQARRADVRLLLLFWHLADRWGRVGPEGVTLPLRLTHERLAELVCLRRPTVSMALGGLREEGRVDRASDGTWILRGHPPDLARGAS